MLAYTGIWALAGQADMSKAALPRLRIRTALANASAFHSYLRYLKGDFYIMSADSENQKKRWEIPHVIVILMAMIAVSACLTWVIPAGSYTRTINEATGLETVVPGSFQYIDKTPITFFQMFVALEESLVATADIAFMIFCVYSSLYLLEKTGAMDALIAHLIKYTKRHEKHAELIMVFLIVFLSVWASTGALSFEEILPFVPAFIALSTALGYDSIVGIGISIVPVGMGFASATVNPFTIGVAQAMSGLRLFSGLTYRLIVLAAMTAITVIYVLTYARRVKKSPDASLTYGIDCSSLKADTGLMDTSMTAERFLTLAGLGFAIIFMAWGLIADNWYLNEVAAIFLMLAIISGILNGWTFNRIASTLVDGFGQGALSAFIIGIGRAVSIILEKGNIIDTIIHESISFMEHLSVYLNGFLMLIFQTLLNFLIPSGSAQATASMPIMAPIADMIGISRQTAVLIFQFGDGFSNLMWPTSFMLLACAMAKIPLYKYYKWLLPFMGICFIVQCLFVFGAITVGY